jgi:hypothetical protein
MKKERQGLVVGGLVALFLILWLGFLFHRSPRFAGSLAGGVLGISATVLMLVPLAYLIVKRIPPLKRAVTKHVSIRTLLAWHIYAGVLGPILGILHTGHKFDSPLGIALTAMMLVVVMSGFIGMYLMSRFSDTIREKRKLLTDLELAYRATATELATHPEQVSVMRPFTGFLTRIVGGAFLDSRKTDTDTMPAPVRALRLSESIADVEFAIRTHEDFKRAFGVWLKFHIVISLVLYALLGLHIWSALHFGLRWFA